MSEPAPFDPYALFEALEANKVHYVVVGGFARVVHGTAESPEASTSPQRSSIPTYAPSIAHSQSSEPPARTASPSTPDTLASGDPITISTPAGTLNVVPAPWGTRGYDDLRIRGNRENLGRGLRPQIASTVDLVRMLEASPRPEDADRLQRLRRIMELERVRNRRRGLQLER